MTDAATITPAPQSETTPVLSPAAPKVPAKPAPGGPARLMSLDAYRGFTMILMASAGLRVYSVAKEARETPTWQFIAHHTDHVAWSGCSLWDLIQPSFMFMVGVSLPYSIASRRAKGDSFGLMFGHAVWRAFLLIVLAVFLTSAFSKHTEFIFTNVLAQIGLGYSFLFLLGWTKPKTQFMAAMGILIAYWAAFALWPLPPENFEYKKVGVPETWAFLSGFGTHWEKNSNIAHYFDVWFLNLFPRGTEVAKDGTVKVLAFTFNKGGYQTLNFIPSLATMIFGLLAGELLRSDNTGAKKTKVLVGAGLACLAIGTLLDMTGICPSVKRIWTPSFAIFSTGWTLLTLAFFYYVIDLKGYQSWTFPMLVVGMNSIAMYCMAQLSNGFIKESLKTHLGQKVFENMGGPFAPMYEAGAILVVMWLICLWMYKRKIFLRI
jgi:heparan-alpha-glucosaminide N-acetyltransferase